MPQEEQATQQLEQQYWHPIEQHGLQGFGKLAQQFPPPVPLGVDFGSKLPSFLVTDENGELPGIAFPHLSYLHENIAKAPEPIVPAAENGDMHIVVLTDVGIC